MIDRARAAVLALCVCAAGLAVQPASSAQAARDASLTITPAAGQYVGGSMLTLTGSLGVSGKRDIRVQRHMNRPGDSWIEMEGTQGTTRRNGSFTLQVPASSMYGISYRVVSAKAATPAQLLQARAQEVALSVESGLPLLDRGQVLLAAPFTIVADTTPVFPGYRDLPPPALPGRTLTLQQRVSGHRWQTLSTTTSDAEGHGRFVVSALQPGEVVYRVRQEDWTAGGDRVGWSASHPMYVDVLPALPTLDRRATQPRAQAPRRDVRLQASSPAQATAASRWGWGQTRFGFDWEYGESLTTPATRGARPKGAWLDASDGTGRAGIRNGGLLFSSEDYTGSHGRGSIGSTWVTLQGNTQKYGRWETRLQTTAMATGGDDFRIRVELVPSGATDPRCGARAITLADYSPGESAVGFGVRTATATQWSGTVGTGPLNGPPHAYAVEVKRKRITWFVDGKPVGAVSGAEAVSDQPLTLRITMAGNGTARMNRTKALVDWVRAYEPDGGRKASTTKRLTRGTHAFPC